MLPFIFTDKTLSLSTFISFKYFPTNEFSALFFSSSDDIYPNSIPFIINLLVLTVPSRLLSAFFLTSISLVIVVSLFLTFLKLNLYFFILMVGY